METSTARNDLDIDDVDLIAEADAEQQAFCAHQRRFFTCIAELDRRGLWEADGCRDVAQWISGRYHVPTYQARLWVAAAHALESLPVLSHAFGTGAVSVDKTVQLARFATPATEADLLRWAKRVTARTIRRKADRAQRRDVAETVAADRERSLSWWLFDADKRVGIEAFLPAAEGMAVVKALERLAERKPRDVEIDEAAGVGGAVGGWDLTVEQRRADALVELCSQALDSDFDADRATVVVNCELSALLGDRTGCEIDGGPVIHAETARRLMCDGRIEVVVRDGERGVVGIGRASREPPPFLYRKVLERDGGCTFPGCGTRRYIHAHHIWHWIAGGPTDLDNLVIVCGFHHRLVHERRWSVRLDDDGSTVWFRPDGTIHDPGGYASAARAP